MYEEVAPEYYDERLHPTSADLRDLSRCIVARWVDRLVGSQLCLEVGAGKSLAAEFVDELGARPVVLLDRSPAMLAHNESPSSGGAVIADARHTPLRGSCVGLILGVLADPFNSVDLWREMGRLLHPDGWAVYTTPAWEWASRSRPAEGAPLTTSRFLTGAGKNLDLPSFIFPPGDQEAMFLEAGMEVVDEQHVTAQDLPGPPRSPKLTARGIAGVPLCRGFLLRSNGGQ